MSVKSNLKLSRYERKVARDSQLKAKKVIQLHYHVCTCTKKWLCRSACCVRGRKSICHYCFEVRRAQEEKTRAIEAERNSVTQLTIQFETKSEPKYEYPYSDFMTWNYVPINIWPDSTSYIKPKPGNEIVDLANIKKAMEEIAKVNPANNSYSISYPSKLASKLSEPGKGAKTASGILAMTNMMYSVQYTDKDGNLVPATQGNPFMTPEEIKEVWQSGPIDI